MARWEASTPFRCTARQKKSAFSAFSCYYYICRCEVNREDQAHDLNKPETQASKLWTSTQTEAQPLLEIAIDSGNLG